MKLSTTLAIAAAMLLMASLTATSDEAVPPKPKGTEIEWKSQTHCPVMGGKIDSTVYTDIQGQRVYHCCPMCSAKLTEDPDTYFKKAAAEGILFENIQTTCPVSGEKLDEKSVFVDYAGRRIALCCEKCRDPFNKDPRKCLAKMDAGTTKEVPSERKDTSDHKGHNH